MTITQTRGGFDAHHARDMYLLLRALDGVSLSPRRSPSLSLFIVSSMLGGVTGVV